jgi:nucleobase:cation symporter-1, NCS1 family
MSTKASKIRMERTHHSLISDGVAEHEQTLKSGKPFWVIFVGNFCIPAWLMGVLVAGMGLDFTNGMFALLVGSIIGSALPALTAVVGPQSRLSQIEFGRFSLGKTGNKLPAFLNWVGAIGWDVINNVVSASAIVVLLSGLGIDAPLWIVFGGLVGLQMVIGIYGHHLIQDMSKYVGVLMALFFFLIGIIAMHNAGVLPVPSKPADMKTILSAVVLLVAFNISWTTYSADYTRYLPKKTPSQIVFLAIFMALFLSLAILGFFGYMTASAVTEQTPDGIMKALQGLTGRFSFLVLFVIGFSAIPANAINDNSAAYSLISSGFKFSRPTSAIFGAVLGYAICLLASSSFVEFFENFLFLFAHWMTPWAAVILIHWFMIGKHEQKTTSGLTLGFVVFFVVSAASIALFSSNALYTGPIADKIGGLDIGPYIGFVVAGVIYYAILRWSPLKTSSSAKGLERRRRQVWVPVERRQKL